MAGWGEDLVKCNQFRTRKKANEAPGSLTKVTQLNNEKQDRKPGLSPHLLMPAETAMLAFSGVRAVEETRPPVWKPKTEDQLASPVIPNICCQTGADESAAIAVHEIRLDKTAQRAGEGDRGPWGLPGILRAAAKTPRASPPRPNHVHRTDWEEIRGHSRLVLFSTWGPLSASRSSSRSLATYRTVPSIQLRQYGAEVNGAKARLHGEV